MPNIMEIDFKDIFVEFVDYLLPELTPYESTMYLLILRRTLNEDGDMKVRIGKRTLAEMYGKGSRGEKTNYAHISKLLKGLEQKGCIKIGKSAHDGTLYELLLPKDIPLVAEKIALTFEIEKDEDYFTIPEKRREIFERDNWECFYCGEELSSSNATLDHFHPQHLGGNHSKDNLKSTCLTCNSVKSGKTYEEAAPYILKSIQERRVRNNK
jgi:hypothetical protein